MRRHLDRTAMTVLVIAILLGIGASWTWAGRVRSVQEQERRDLNLFLDASSAGWAEVSEQFFAVPERTAEFVGALVGQANSTEDRVALLAEAVRTSPALDAAFLGYDNGEFLFVGRSDEKSAGGFRTRDISIDADQRTVTLTWTDAELTELERTIAVDDTYDPRVRPWYLTSTSERSEMWTEPYVFASSGQPGITYSMVVQGDTPRERGARAGGIAPAVVGIDMRLTELGGFLDLLAPGDHGEAQIIDSNGQVIAASSMTSPPLTLGDVDDALSVLPAMFAEASIAEIQAGTTDVARAYSADGKWTAVLRSARDTEEWYLTAQALDSDFLREVSNRSLKNLLSTVAVGLATTMLVGTLAYWALRYRATLKDEAERDELTGTLSRRALRRVLDDSLRNARRPVPIAIIDLDHFKAVNDQYGHLVGDGVLAAMAQRIATFGSNNGASVGRLGGDEFAVVGGEITEWNQLVEQLKAPVTIAGNVFELGGSVGVAYAQPDDSRPAQEILRQADHALMNVKRAGGNGVQIARLAATSRG